MPISAGELRERVTVQRLTDTLDEFGQSAGVWQNVGNPVPARVTPVRARDQFNAGAVQDTGSIIVVVRFRSDITADMRLIWRGTAYAIQGRPIDVKARREGLEMFCVVDTRDSRASEP